MIRAWSRERIDKIEICKSGMLPDHWLPEGFKSSIASEEMVGAPHTCLLHDLTFH